MKEELGGGRTWRSKEGLPYTRAKEVSANSKLPYFFVIVFCIFLLPLLSYSFPLFLLAHLIAGCPPPIFIFQDGVFWRPCIIPLLDFMMGSGIRNRREEEQEDSGPHMSFPMYDEEEGFEEEGDELKGNTETLEGKAALTPLWNYVTKLEGGKGGGSYKFLCPHGCHGGKPFSGSYTRVRKHLCGVMDSDEKKGAVGIQICPNISTEQRRKCIQIEEVAQQKSKKQKTQSESSATSRFGISSPHGTSANFGGRTIVDFLNVPGRDDVDGKIVRFLCACGVPFNVLHSLCWHDMVKAINEAPK